MSLITEFKYRLRSFWVPILGMCLALYVAYHAFQGKDGVLSYVRVRAQLTSAQARLQDLRKEHTYLLDSIALLRDSSLDPDTIEGEVRSMFRVVYPRELVIVLPKAH